MELTADVIDDVLRELETSINQEAVERPIISAARKLTKPQLRALDALGQCTATFDQTCFLYALSSDASSEPTIPREALLLALDNFVSLGILKVIDNKISFAGDEFDRTYIRYHAERANVSVNPGTGPFSFTLGVKLNRALILRVGDEAYVDWGNDDVSAPVLESMTSLLDPESGAVTESISLVINHVIDALPYGQLLLLKVTVTYDGTSAFTWLAFKEEDYVKFIETEKLAQLSQKIEENNGTLTVEEFRFPLPPEEWIIDRILSSGNNRLAREIGAGYLRSAALEYFRGRRESALSKVEHGLRFPLLAVAVSDAGYMNLASGEYKSAEELFARAVGLALADDEYFHAAIAMYNRGAALVMLGDRPGALKQWEEARKLAESPETFALICLFVPKISSENLIMSEVKNPGLSATIEEAVNTLTNLTADVTVPELELNNDLGTDLDLD
jgi:tetratricopeptide (TPR) repeat protein